MTNADADLSAVAAIRQALEAAENAGNADAAAMFLADDAVVMVPDFPVVEGKDACTRFMRDVMGRLSAQFNRRIAYVSAEVVIIGDLAFDRGTFSFTVAPRSGGDSTQVTGKYLWLLRRTAEEPWRIARLIVGRDEEAEPDSVRQRVFPQLRMTSWDRTRAFYMDGLGFTVDWEHRFEPGFPVFASVTRAGLSLFLSEHSGDGALGGAAYLVVDNVDALFEEIRGRNIMADPPEDTPWGTREITVLDPDGNALRFGNPKTT